MLNHKGWSRTRWWMVIGGVQAVRVWLDFETGPFVLFPITFVLPVTLAEWYLGRWEAIGVGTILVSARFGMMLVWGAPGFAGIIGLSNAVIPLVVLVILGVLVELVARQERAFDGPCAGTRRLAADLLVLQEDPCEQARMGAGGGVRGRTLQCRVQSRFV